MVRQQGTEWNQFLLASGNNAADPGCVYHMVVQLGGLPGTDFHRRARVVGNHDILTRQEREDLAFSYVWVTDKNETPLLAAVPPYLCRCIAV
jgi:hypothetical protein